MKFHHSHVRGASTWLVTVIALALLSTGHERLRAEITIAGDDWAAYEDLGGVQNNNGLVLPEFVETEDGLGSMHFVGCPDALDYQQFVTYRINVTSLPAGETRFPVRLEARNVQSGNTGNTIRNLTIDPNPDLQAQASFVSVTFEPDPLTRLARDERVLLDPLGFEGRDDAGLLEGLPSSNLGACDATLDTELPGNEPGEVTTLEATLELQLGENLLQIDTTDARDIPDNMAAAVDGESGHQLFTLVIGPGEPELVGEFLPSTPACTVSRGLPDDRYESAGSVAVTLTAQNLSGATTVVETFPVGWTVTSAGGGTVDANTITFSFDADGEKSYELTASDACETVTFTGTFMGAGGCAGDVGGGSEMGCVPPVVGGITIAGDDWDEWIELQTDVEGASPEPEIVETEDGMKALHLRGFPPDGADSDMYATYEITVTQLPGGGEGPERFPIRAEVRSVGGNAGMAIRNLTVAPIDEGLFYPDNIAQQASFVAVGVHADLGADNRAMGTGPQPFDPCADVLDEDSSDVVIVEPWGDAGQTEGVSPFAPTDNVGVLQTETVMLDLVLGENLIRIDSTDVRDLPCQYLGESGHQVFSLTIGPGETDLLGGIGAVLPAADRFVRGDADSDGSVSLTDGIRILGWLFSGGTAPTCLDAADTDDSGAIILNDAVLIFGWLFQGGAAPSPPSPSVPAYPAAECGPDPSDDDGLDCAVQAGTCQQ